MTPEEQQLIHTYGLVYRETFRVWAALDRRNTHLYPPGRWSAKLDRRNASGEWNLVTGPAQYWSFDLAALLAAAVLRGEL